MRTLVRFGSVGLLAFGLLALSGRPAAAQAANVKSKLTVTVPVEKAELFIEDQPTKATGKTREFETPPLEAGKEYKYAFKVSWHPNTYTVITRKKEITFKAGDDLNVDLTKEEPGNDTAQVIFVPTPDEIVAEMIKLAGVKADDVVFEPGCGDARVTIAAVKAGAKRGVGIDLNPERVTEAKANAKKNGVDAKVEIRQGDALKVPDYTDATVVFSYMANEFNDLMRPVLWKQLKVGSRVVSHRFIYGDWKSDKSIKVKDKQGEEYDLHVWTITEEVKKKAEKK